MSCFPHFCVLDNMLTSFLKSFKSEPVIVQLNILTSMVKLFLKKPSPETHKLVEETLDIATKHTDNPDVRDRGNKTDPFTTQPPGRLHLALSPVPQYHPLRKQLRSWSDGTVFVCVMMTTHHVLRIHDEINLKTHHLSGLMHTR